MEETTTPTLLEPPVRITPAMEPQAEESDSPARFSLKRAYAQTFGATIAVRLLGAASGIFAARLLGPVGRGELAVITLLPTMLLPLGEIELPRALAYKVSRHPEQSKSVSGNGLWLGFCLGCLQMLFLASVIGLFLPSDKAYLLHDSRWFMLYLPAVFLLTCAMGLDQGQGKFGRFSCLQIAPGLIYVALIFFAYRAKAVSPEIFAIGIFLGAALPAAFRVTVDWRQIPKLTPDLHILRELLTQGLRFYVPALASLALTRADSFLLIRFAPSEQVGLYVVAQAIAVGQLGAVSPFVQVGFTAIAAQHDRARALATLARHFRIAVIVVCVTALALAALAPIIIRLAFGSKFTSATPATFLLIAATVFAALGQMLDQGLRAAGYSKAAAACNFAGLTVLCSLGVLAIRRFGIVGLGSTVLLSYFVTLAALLSFALLKLRMSLSALSPFTASALDEAVSMLRGVFSRWLLKRKSLEVAL